MPDSISEKIARKIGYIIGYFVFTTILYFILNYFNKIPSNWAYWHIALITLLITLIGALIMRLIK